MLCVTSMGTIREKNNVINSVESFQNLNKSYNQSIERTMQTPSVQFFFLEHIFIGLNYLDSYVHNAP